MFFEKINGLMTEGVDLTLTIRKREGVLVVSSLPKANGLKDDAQNLMAPFTVSGTTAELDAGFLMALQQPVQRAAGLLTNMRQHEQQLQSAQKNSKGGKEQTAKATKVDEKQQKFDKHMARGKELEKEGKFSEALTQYMQARLHASEEAQKTVDEKIRAVKIRMSEQSLFDMPPVEAPVIVQATAEPVMAQQAAPQVIESVQHATIQPTSSELTPIPTPTPAAVPVASTAAEPSSASVDDLAPAVASVAAPANKSAQTMEMPLFAPEPTVQPVPSAVPPVMQTAPQSTVISEPGYTSAPVSEPAYVAAPIGDSGPAPQTQQSLSPDSMPSWMNYSNGLDDSGLPY